MSLECGISAGQSGELHRPDVGRDGDGPIYPPDRSLELIPKTCGTGVPPVETQARRLCHRA
jgi:hypothetical protein